MPDPARPVQRATRSRAAAAALLAAGLVAVGGSSSSTPAASSGSTSSQAATPTTPIAQASSGAPTSLSVETIPPSASDEPANPAATGTFLMMKLYVGDIAAGEKFYGAVFGAKPTLAVGAGA